MSHISEVEYSELMNQSYIDYSMSVITDRAVPDARDGLKPVQRRVLYDMYKQHIHHNKPYKKCAKIVGDVLGRFHPHGDQSAYDALVVMAQPWKRNECFVDGHGNFGSLEGDVPAAMRYTEARLSEITEDCFLSDLDKPIVTMQPNFDNTETEPEVLPCLIPNVLISGAEGIAVGMTTKIPPHNTGEVIDVALKYLENPEARLSTLVKYLPSPDFPSGGIITAPESLKAFYESGKGKFKIRGKYHIEQLPNSTKKQIIITELPYTMLGENIHKFLNDVAKLVESKEIVGITDISNQSSKGDIRIVFDVRGNADAEEIMKVIYQKTKFEDTFSANMLVVHNKKPEVVNLKRYLEIFIQFQRELYDNKFKYLKEQFGHKCEVLSGLIEATKVMPAIVDMLSGCKAVEQGRKCLMTGDISGITFSAAKFAKIAEKFRFTEIQANKILEMKLSQLVKMEIDTLSKQHEEAVEQLQYYAELVANPQLRDKEIRKTLLKIKRKYAKPRKTQIMS
jgi:DNA gyrase subunit A